MTYGAAVASATRPAKAAIFDNEESIFEYLEATRSCTGENI
jgi:hypothetical protein